LGVLALSAVCRHEEPAVRAFEAPVALGLTGHQFGRERLLAVGAHDLACRLLGGDLGHVATLPILRPPVLQIHSRPEAKRRVAA
jgi:hypothetical protein